MSPIEVTEVVTNEKGMIPFKDAGHISFDYEGLVKVTKDAKRELNDRIMLSQLTEVMAKTINPARIKAGWAIEIVKPSEYGRIYSREYNYGQHDKPLYSYYVSFRVYWHSDDKERPNLENEFLSIVKQLETKIKFPAQWEIAEVNGEDWKAKKAAVAKDKEDHDNVDIGYLHLEIPEDFEVNFDHLYGLEAHISRVKRAIEGTIETGWKKRLHCALIGPPGCGKSDICGSLKAALGPENVLEFDATSTTMAGAQKELADRVDSGQDLPRVLLVEEIEKADEKSLAWLLSLMDLRGEIRKTTARGKINTDTKMICIATVNDVPTFKKIAFGALYSRFSNKIYFRRPDRQLLGLILKREVDAIEGKDDWINPTLDLADEINTTDPREVISLLLCGRDALLTGEFQKEYMYTALPPEYE